MTQFSKIVSLVGCVLCATAHATTGYSVASDDKISVTSRTEVFLRVGDSHISSLGGTQMPESGFGSSITLPSVDRVFDLTEKKIRLPIKEEVQFTAPTTAHVEARCVCHDSSDPGRTGTYELTSTRVVMGITSPAPVTAGCPSTGRDVDGHLHIKVTFEGDVGDTYFTASSPTEYLIRNGTTPVSISMNRDHVTEDSELAMTASDMLGFMPKYYYYSAERSVVRPSNMGSIYGWGWWYTSNGQVHFPSDLEVADTIDIADYNICDGEPIHATTRANMQGIPFEMVSSTIENGHILVDDSSALELSVTEHGTVANGLSITTPDTISCDSSTVTMVRANAGSSEWYRCSRYPCVGCKSSLVRPSGLKTVLGKPIDWSGVMCTHGRHVVSAFCESAAETVPAETVEAPAPMSSLTTLRHEATAGGAKTDVGLVVGISVAAGLLVAAAAYALVLYRRRSASKKKDNPERVPMGDNPWLGASSASRLRRT